MFNLTNKPVEKLAKKLVKMAPGMNHVFFSDDGSTAMEVSIKIALQYWKNIGEEHKNKIATLQNGYHGDTFGAMSVGYVPEFFSNFKSKLFTSIQFLVPNEYRKPKNQTFIDHQNHCLENIERITAKEFLKNMAIIVPIPAVTPGRSPAPAPETAPIIELE